MQKLIFTMVLSFVMVNCSDQLPFRTKLDKKGAGADVTGYDARGNANGHPEPNQGLEADLLDFNYNLNDVLWMAQLALPVPQAITPPVNGTPAATTTPSQGAQQAEGTPAPTNAPIGPPAQQPGQATAASANATDSLDMVAKTLGGAKCITLDRTQPNAILINFQRGLCSRPAGRFHKIEFWGRLRVCRGDTRPCGGTLTENAYAVGLPSEGSFTYRVVDAVVGAKSRSRPEVVLKSLILLAVRSPSVGHESSYEVSVKRVSESVRRGSSATEVPVANSRTGRAQNRRFDFNIVQQVSFEFENAFLSLALARASRPYNDPQTINRDLMLAASGAIMKVSEKRPENTGSRIANATNPTTERQLKITHERPMQFLYSCDGIHRMNGIFTLSRQVGSAEPTGRQNFQLDGMGFRAIGANPALSESDSETNPSGEPLSVMWPGCNKGDLESMMYQRNNNDPSYLPRNNRNQPGGATADNPLQ